MLAVTTLNLDDDDPDHFALWIANNILAPKVEAAFKEELAKALADGFTAEEVEAAKNTFLQDNLLRMSQDAFVAQTLGRYSEFGRSMTRLTETRTKVAALTPGTNAAFKKWIDPAGISYFKAGDFKMAGSCGFGEVRPIWIGRIP